MEHLVAQLDTVIKGQPNVGQFWIFVVCCVLVIFFVLVFLFYFNRLLARVATLLINQYLWRRYGAYIQLDSVRFTLLGARLLFRNFKYHSTNMSIAIVKGHITMRYWFFNIRKSSTESDDTKLPCRIMCSVEGLEWFIYNNAPVYERMKTMLGLETDARLDPEMGHDLHKNMVGDLENPTMAELSLLERFLPMEFECTKGALIIGNRYVPSYIVWKAAQITGTFSAEKSRSPLDYYKSCYDVVLRKPQVSLEKSTKYTGPLCGDDVHFEPRQTRWQAFMHGIRWLLCLRSNDALGQRRDSDHDRDQEKPYASHKIYQEDYAKMEMLMEFSQMKLTYTADYAGPVPASHANAAVDAYPGIDIGNGDAPPEWNLRIDAWNAMMYYGPWTDKQRALLQDYYFPNAHRSNKPTPRLQPGDTRMAISFDVWINFETDVVLRIPTREASKDWRYMGDVSELDIDKDGYYSRPHGWLDIKAKAGSSIKTCTPFAADDRGFTSTIEVDLKKIEVYTSVNFANLLQANRFKMLVEMPSPLVWNEHREWKFSGALKRPEIFLLRDHITLFQDLIKDWTSGPSADLAHFVPITYTIDLAIPDPKVYLCVNEHNIINNPNSVEDNAYIILAAHDIKFNATLPFLYFEPDVNTIHYSAKIGQLRGTLSLPSSHTWSAFMNRDDTQVASSMVVNMGGSFQYYSSVDVLRHIESVNLKFDLEGAAVKLFGSVIRYLFILRNNFVGSGMHFATVDEYRQRRADPDAFLEMRKHEAESKPMTDPFEIYILCNIKDGVLFLPENLYECSHYSQLEFQELQVELRNLDIYMDLYVTISPITWTRDSSLDPSARRSNFRTKNARDPKNYLYIDETNIYAHRLFGPLPETATYLCHWDFNIGRIMGELKPSFLMGASNFAQTFVYNLLDEDNAVTSELEPGDLPDVTFVKAHVREIDIHLMTQNSAAQLQLAEGIAVEFDNLVNEKYDQRVAIRMPKVGVACLANQENDRQNKYSWVEVAKLSLGLNLSIFRHTKDWQQRRMAQQDFIQSQDYLTNRCTHLYNSESAYPASSHRSRTSSRNSQQDHHVGVLYAPVYRMFPLNLSDDSDGSSTSTETPTMDMRRPSMSSENISLRSFNWSFASETDGEGDDEEEGDFGLSYEESTDSSSSEYHAALTFSSDDEHSLDGLGDDLHSEDLSTEEPSSGRSAIPQSIPYSGYLERYCIERASMAAGRSQAFFHPYIPPPQTKFTSSSGKTMDDELSDDDYYMEDDDPLRVFMDDAESDPTTSRREGGENDAIECEHKGDVVTTTILEATRAVTILVTPILVKVVQELTEVINKDDWDLETMLDSSQIKYVDQLTRLLTDKFICTRFAVLLPSTRLHFIQNVMVPADLSSYKYKHQSHLEALQQDEEDKMLCAANVFFDDLKLIGGVTFQDYGFEAKDQPVAESRLLLDESRVHVSIGTMGCQVHYITAGDAAASSILFGIPEKNQNMRSSSSFKRRSRFLDEDDEDEDDEDTRTVQPSDPSSRHRVPAAPMANETVVIDLVLKGMSCRWVGARNPNFLDVAVGSFDTIIITESVEILVGAVYAWLVFVDDLQRILERFQDRRLFQTQVLLHELANVSKDARLVSSDPHFLTIPTTMGLRIGTRNFRNDVGWKLLARLRQCLRLLPSTMREKLQYQLTSGIGANTDHDIDTAATMYAQVIDAFSGWRNWEIGRQDLRDCRLFTTVFGQSRPSSQLHGRRPLSTSTTTTTSSMDTPTGDGQAAGDFTKDLIDFFMTSTNYAKLGVGRFSFAIYEEEEPDQPDNRIVIKDVAFAVDTVYKRSSIGASLSPGVPITTNVTPSNTTATLVSPFGGQAKHASAGNHHHMGYLDVITKLDIGSIAIDVDPMVMAFAQHMLLVQRVFTTKLQDLSHTTKSSSIMGRSQHRTMYGPKTPSPMPTPSPQASPAAPTQALDLDFFLSRMDVVSQALLRVKWIGLNARAQKLAAKTSVQNILGSVVLSNPRLSSSASQQPYPHAMALLHSEKDSDTSSGGKRSSSKATKKQAMAHGTSRIIMDASGSIEKIGLDVSEALSRHASDAKQLLDVAVHQAKLNASISQPTSTRSGPRKKIDPAVALPKVLSIFSCVESLQANVPRRILQLYGFIQEWRGEQGKKYHFMFQNLLNELEEQRRAESLANSPMTPTRATVAVSSVPPRARWYDIKLQFLLVNMQVKASLLQSLHIQYSLQDVLLMVSDTLPITTSNTTTTRPMASSAAANGPPKIQYELTLDKQMIELITLGDGHAIKDNVSLFHLPCITSAGSLTEWLQWNKDNTSTHTTTYLHPNQPPLRRESNAAVPGRHLRARLSIDFVPITLDVGMIDSILTAHSLIGNEVNELVEKISYSKRREKRKNSAPSVSSTTTSAEASSTLSPATRAPSLFYSVDVTLTGLCISTTSPTAVVLFESKLLTAMLANYSHQQLGQRHWLVSGKSFALSLDHAEAAAEAAAATDAQREKSLRQNRLAYIVVDFQVENQPLTSSMSSSSNEAAATSTGSTEAYAIHLTRVQTLMQPIALGKMADLYIHYDAELKKKHELKRDEINDLADNTKRIMASFQDPGAQSQVPDMHEIWKDRQLALRIDKFGVAIPLLDSQMLAFADDNSHGHSSNNGNNDNNGGALLFALSSLDFTTKHTKTTTAMIQSISLQFVKQFDQRKDEHFVATHHPRMNRMHFPAISCKVDSAFDKEARRLRLHFNALVSGFEIDLDSSIADYINRLVVIYVESMDRVTLLATSPSSRFATSASSPSLHQQGTSAATAAASELIHLIIDGQFKYESGTVRLYPTRHQQHQAHVDPLQKRSGRTQRSVRPLSGSGNGNGGLYPLANSMSREVREGSNMATIKVPGLQAAFTYQTPLGASSGASESPHRFNGHICILESNNTLHPSLVQFLHEVTVGLKVGVQQSSERKESRKKKQATTPLDEESSMSFSNSLHGNVSIVLQLSKTHVELTCQPMSKVMCSLGWQDSVFVLNTYSTDDERTFSCAGSLHAISTVVKHQYSPLSCLEASIDTVTFNAMLTSKRAGPLVNSDDISIVIKVPQVDGAVNMRQLQDLLILNNCWFSQPIMATSAPPAAEPSPTTSIRSTTPLPFARYTALQLDQMSLSVDMGQAIGTIKLTPTNLLVETHMVPGVSQGIGFAIDAIRLEASGRLSGNAHIHRIILDGHVKSGLASALHHSTCQLYLLFNGVEAAFTYEFQNILHLIQEPIQLRATVNLQRDRQNSHQRALQQLTMAIHAGRTTASISIKTIPVVIVMHRRFVELLEKKKSEASLVNPTWATRTTSSNRPSLVAPVENEHPLLFAFLDAPRRAQPESKATLHVDGIQIIVYPSQFQDGDNVQVAIKQIQGHLHQVPNTLDSDTTTTTTTTITRDLRLGIDKAALLKNVPGTSLMAWRKQQLELVKIANEPVGSNSSSSSIPSETHQQRHGKQLEKSQLFLPPLDTSRRKSSGQSVEKQANDTSSSSLSPSSSSSHVTSTTPAPAPMQSPPPPQAAPGNTASMDKQQQQMAKIEDKGQPIFTLPITVLTMHSVHKDRRINHSFAVDFKDRVQVSLNFGQINYLRDFVKMFNDQMDRARIATTTLIQQQQQQLQQQLHAVSSASSSPKDDASSATSSPATALPTMDATGASTATAETSPASSMPASPSSTDTVIRPQGAATIVPMTAPESDTDTSPTSPPAAAHQDAKDEYYTYIADVPVDFEPQLRQMGEATPPVEWLLGIKRERLPGLVHENVTLPLDQVVHAIWDFYQKRVQDS
ncbi:hypothetical protein BC940DRAFT_271416 [Gongronella butleri]|nr:hypothetical protein BC940DRAFT_271416 [Gongronella butleri]